MFDAFANIFKIPDLRKRVIFTLSILAVLYIGQYISIPGVNPVELQIPPELVALRRSFNDRPFAGGAFGRVSIFALGIMPYISASIILQLLTVTSPYLEELSKKGEEGRKKINQYTRYGTVVITAFQSFMLSFSLENTAVWGDIVYNPGWGFRIMCMISMTTGTVLLMWLGELITERGIGNGISLIIFANIVNQIPAAVGQAWIYLSTGEPSFTPLDALVTFIVFVLVIAAIVLIQYGQRRVPIKRGRMVRGGRMYGAQSNSYLPLRINTAGVIPVIFAAAILILPATLLQFMTPSGSEGFLVISMVEWNG